MQQSTKSQQGWDTGQFHSAGIEGQGSEEERGREEKRNHAEMLLNMAVWANPDGGRKMLSRNSNLSHFYSVLKSIIMKLLKCHVLKGVQVREDAKIHIYMNKWKVPLHHHRAEDSTTELRVEVNHWLIAFTFWVTHLLWNQSGKLHVIKNVAHTFESEWSSRPFSATSPSVSVMLITGANKRKTITPINTLHFTAADQFCWTKHWRGIWNVKKAVLCSYALYPAEGSVKPWGSTHPLTGQQNPTKYESEVKLAKYHI